MRVFHNCSLMLFGAAKSKKEGGHSRSLSLFLLLSFSDISVIQTTATPLPPSSISVSFSPVSAPSVLYLAFFLTISCCLLLLSPLFFPPPPNSPLYRCLSCAILISSPVSPQPNASLRLPLPLSLTLPVFGGGGPSPSVHRFYKSMT